MKRYLATAALLLVALTGCSGASHAAYLSETGSGSRTFSIPNPDASETGQTVTLMTTFQCRPRGRADVTLTFVEDPGIYERSDDCGGPSGYEMHLPAGGTSFTFRVVAPDDVRWTFTWAGSDKK